MSIALALAMFFSSMSIPPAGGDGRNHNGESPGYPHIPAPKR